MSNETSAWPADSREVLEGVLRDERRTLSSIADCRVDLHDGNGFVPVPGIAYRERRIAVLEACVSALAEPAP